MTQTFPTEEMALERSEALVRIRQQQREEETRLRREMDLPVWRDWMFWLGVLLLGAKFKLNGWEFSSAPSPLGVVVILVALDRVSRRRSRAARELEDLCKDTGSTPDN